MTKMMEQALRMRAVSQSTAGGPEVLTLVDLPRPQPSLTEVLVRVHAAGVNPTDWKTRARGEYATGVRAPFVLGFDVSGVVEEVGPGVTIFAPGDEVFGMPRFPHPAGTYAEYVTAPARHLVRKPAEISHVTAAAIPLAALTAWQALVDTAHIRSGDRVLVHAAAGGVGHIAVQIAKAHGAYVIGTATAAKHPIVLDLGADEVVDYTAGDFSRNLRDIDIVLDPIGGDTTTRSLRTLRRGGTLVSLLPFDPAFPLGTAGTAGTQITRLFVEPDHAGMESIAWLVRQGSLRPIIDATFPLEAAALAHERGEAGRTVGKIVLEVT